MTAGDPLFERLPGRFRWTAHNLFAHPLFKIGLENWGNQLHDCTIPAHEAGTGRG